MIVGNGPLEWNDSAGVPESEEHIAAPQGVHSMTEKTERPSNDQAAQQELIETARSMPGVAEVMDVYGQLTAYTRYVVTHPNQVRNATGGNAG